MFYAHLSFFVNFKFPFLLSSMCKTWNFVGMPALKISWTWTRRSWRFTIVQSWRRKILNRALTEWINLPIISSSFKQIFFNKKNQQKVNLSICLFDVSGSVEVWLTHKAVTKHKRCQCTRCLLMNCSNERIVVTKNCWLLVILRQRSAVGAVLCLDCTYLDCWHTYSRMEHATGISPYT